ncbi:MAG TPA: glycoside hydrolase family 38 C-terminal domain-containing protein [Verrucomicrobiae bacterium]|nr:glycoside hydrolase family 38 C-terminal domain-containing protein [Verrucomicrobiae bacterium]
MPRHRFPLSLLLIFFAAACASAQSTQPPPDPYKPVLDRLQSITSVPLSSWYVHDADLPHGEDPSLDASSWPQVKIGEDWQGSRWLRQTFEVPANLYGYSLQGARISLDLEVNSDIAVYISVFSNGSMVARTDEGGQVPIPLIEHAQPGQKFVLAVRVIETGGAGCCGGNSTRLQRAELRIEPSSDRPDPALLRLEILSAEPLIAAYPDGQAARRRQLDTAVNAISLPALDRGDQQAFDTSLRAAQSDLDVLRPYMSQFRISAVGNSHIDMAWLWPWTETVEVVRNTFGTALELMREYPGFKFTASTAQAYVWMEEKYPPLFREIQQRVKEGRWEVTGGMWVEPDLNMPGGESLVRQILYGKRYFQQKFGVDINIGWNPDSFGYNWQLPQIYKRSGIDYFVTQKLLWAHEYTSFPYRLFWWESPDGSRILTYFPSEYANQIDPRKMARDSSVYGPMLWKYDAGTNSAPPGSLDTMYLYGVGDHGGGPTREDLDTAVRWQQKDLVFPQIQFSTAAEYFAGLEKRKSELKIPTWDGELYFQYHRGVQTTQSEEKKGNRENEVLILDAEKLASIDTLFGVPYPQDNLDDAWKKILFNQFHDILPGSGIHINYVDAARKYAETERIDGDIIHGALTDLASRVDSRGTGVLVFNPLSWPRSGEVEVDAQFPEPVKQLTALGPDGEPLLSRVLSADPLTGRVKLRILAENVPATGYELIRLVPSASSKPSRAKASEARSGRLFLSATPDSLENAFIRLKIDPKTGCITSLFDKRSRTEALALPVASEGSPAPSPDGLPCGDLLQAFVDKPKHWDAWNIDADFVDHHWDLMQADEVKLIENTPLRAVIRVRHHFQNSTFIQDVTMYAGVPRVDVRMQADWHERHILLKVAFPLSARNDNATFEIPYGAVERPTTRRTPAEQAQFEVPALRWADLSDATHGFSLLNASKYGYDAKDNVLRLSLLRSPTWPDPETDQGHHEFTYSLYPHAGTWRDALTVEQGYDLNYPLFAVSTSRHAGPLPSEKSFFSTEENNVVITAVKKDADDNSLILRYYEWAGKKGVIHIRLPRPASAAWETNLMEAVEHPLALGDSSTVVAVPTGPYEIKTVKLQFPNP